MEPIQFFNLNLSKKSAGRQTQKLKLGFYNLYTPCKVLNMHEGLCDQALAQSPQRWIEAMMFSELLSGKDSSAL